MGCDDSRHLQAFSTTQEGKQANLLKTIGQCVSASTIEKLKDAKTKFKTEFEGKIADPKSSTPKLQMDVLRRSKFVSVNSGPWISDVQKEVAAKGLPQNVAQCAPGGTGKWDKVEGGMGCSLMFPDFQDIGSEKTHRKQPSSRLMTSLSIRQSLDDGTVELVTCDFDFIRIKGDLNKRAATVEVCSSLVPGEASAQVRRTFALHALDAPFLGDEGWEFDGSEKGVEKRREIQAKYTRAGLESAGYTSSEKNAPPHVIRETTRSLDKSVPVEPSDSKSAPANSAKESGTGY
ncbi:hypothetical protein WDW86_11990 [Bdellovibrionota bacterium FG-2]